MDARSAIMNAKKLFSDVFSDEGVMNVGLEEVRYNDRRKNWLITLGFSKYDGAGASIAQITGKFDNFTRIYKVVELKDYDGKLVSITNRDQITE